MVNGDQRWSGGGGRTLKTTDVKAWRSVCEEGGAEFWDWKKGKDECQSETDENKMIKVAQEIRGSHFDSCRCSKLMLFTLAHL